MLTDNSNKSLVDKTLRGNATGFDRAKYNIKSSIYPLDLMSANPEGTVAQNKYGGNYVVFYINVSTESKIIRENTVKTVDDSIPRNRGAAIGTEYDRNQVRAAAIMGTAAGAGVIGALGGSELGSASAAIGTAALVGLDIEVGESGTFTRAQKRLEQVVALHMPNQLNIRYNTQWADDETAGFAALASLTGDTVNALAAAVARSEESSDAIDKLARSASSIASSVALNAAFGKSSLSGLTGLAANPKKEQVFKGVDFRNFQFDYQFFPRSEDEARAVMEIIKTFKYHMHPEFKDANNFLYIYPSEFDIFYYTNDVENMHIHRHTSCVLTDMSVNYTPNGVFNAFPNGMPTQINIVLSFKELALLSKENIADGL